MGLGHAWNNVLVVNLMVIKTHNLHLFFPLTIGPPLRSKNVCRRTFKRYDLKLLNSTLSREHMSTPICLAVTMLKLDLLKSGHQQPTIKKTKCISYFGSLFYSQFLTPFFLLEIKQIVMSFYKKIEEVSLSPTFSSSTYYNWSTINQRLQNGLSNTE